MGILSIKDRQADTVIFDFDGTLAVLNIDFEQMRREIHTLIAAYGIDHTGLNRPFVLELIGEAGRLIGRQDDKESAFTDEAYRLIEEIEIQAAKQGRLFQKTKQLLTALEKASVRTGIITRNCLKAVRTVFPDIDSYCPVLVTREDVHHVKPHPEQIGLALEKLGADARRTLMVGDHPLDIETGIRGGTLTAGVLTGKYHETDFMAARADLVLAEAAQLLKYLSPQP
jgi:phosphoglycolate phosphatase